MTGQLNGGLVTAVIPGSGTNPDTVNVATGGPDGTPNVLCTYPVQAGDTVWIDQNAGQWYVVVNASRKVSGASVPAIQFGNSPPAGARQLATLYDASGSDGVVRLFGVYSTPPVVPPAATPFIAALSRTYDNVNGWDTRNDDSIRQGSPKDFRAITSSTGCWFYGDIPAALGGATPTSCSFHIIRAGSGGVYGPVPVHLALHSNTAPTGGPPTVVTAVGSGPSLSVNGFDDIVLPADWVAALVSGAAKGVCVTSSSVADYAVFRGAATGSGTLSFS